MKSNLKNIDWILVFCMLAILTAGMLAIYSAAYSPERGSAKAMSLVQKQLSTAIVGLILLAVVASLDDHILPRISGLLYWSSVAMLLYVDFFGRASRGSQRWIKLGFFELQPSEPAKVILIITLSAFFLANYEQIRELRTLLRSLAHVALPLALIFKQPDLGTSLVLGSIWLGVSLAAGVKFNYVMSVLGISLLAFVVGWHTGIIKDYQKVRLTSFINPEADPRASGYHITQSKIAIGSGEMTGKGYLEGSQSKLHFIPEQQTDFVFTIVGEETGFAGSVVLVGLYWLLVSRIALAMQQTEERFGRMIAGGVLAMFLFHIFVNIGMTLGIMPVTGVPLPLMSYGRSNLISTFIAIGLIIGVNIRKMRINFA